MKLLPNKVLVNSRQQLPFTIENYLETELYLELIFESPKMFYAMDVAEKSLIDHLR